MWIGFIGRSRPTSAKVKTVTRLPLFAGYWADNVIIVVVVVVVRSVRPLSSPLVIGYHSVSINDTMFSISRRRVVTGS